MTGWVWVAFTLGFVAGFVTTRQVRRSYHTWPERWVPPTPVVDESGEPRVVVDRTVPPKAYYPTKAICRGCGQPHLIDDRGFIVSHDRPPPWTPFEPTDAHCEGSGEPPRAA